LASQLGAAHRGYEYQDLVVATKLVDLLLGSISSASVDQKLSDSDRFDDLTTVDKSGHQQRVQVKYQDHPSVPLSLREFTKDKRRLALDELVKSAIADRERLVGHEGGCSFRIFSNHTVPDDPKLSRALLPADPDPGPFFPGLNTQRLRFDTEILWQSGWDGGSRQPNPFSFLMQGVRAVEREDLNWLCERLVIEVGGPSLSRKEGQPSPAEVLLLSRLKDEVGIGRYPNHNCLVEDFASRMVDATRFARQGESEFSVSSLRQFTQLRTDFGAITAAHPVDQNSEVSRDEFVQHVIGELRRGARESRATLIVGPPGHGKSWVCKQVVEALKEQGSIVAEHYCYLGEADGNRAERVLGEYVFGSIVRRIAEQAGESADNQRPRFAADHAAVVELLRRLTGDRPDRLVAIVIDGIDHVTRVSNDRSLGDPSCALVESLGALQMPPGSVLVVLSQPGPHLSPLEQANALRIDVPRMTDEELRQLALRQGMILQNGNQEAIGSPNRNGLQDIADFLKALSQRSKGNALYATYICREIRRRSESLVNAAGTVWNLPDFDGTLESYYTHLTQALEPDGGGSVADVLALVDFAVSRDELKEIRPDLAHRVDDAIDTLGPVLIERPTQGGVRIYHESFARFLRQSFSNCPETLGALVTPVTKWLDARGLTHDARAFHSLLHLLQVTARHDRVIELIGPDFVSRSIANGYPEAAIIKNLKVALRSAAATGDWPAVARCNELARSARTFQAERFVKLLVEYADIAFEVLSRESVAARLLHDDYPVMSGSEGIRMCAAVDESGDVAPWQQYFEAYKKESENGDYLGDDDSSRPIRGAILRGHLRLAKTEFESASSTANPQLAEGATFVEIDEGSQRSVDWTAIAALVSECGDATPGAVGAVFDTFGYQGLREVAARLDRPSGFCLAVAQGISTGAISAPRDDARVWAEDSVRHGIHPGTFRDILDLGVNVNVLSVEHTDTEPETLAGLTERVQDQEILSTSLVEAWVDRCSIAALVDPLALDSAEIAIVGSGWYRCWLRFVVGLSRAEVAPTGGRSACALKAILLLQVDLRPFEGEPPSCDLYSIHGIIRQTIRRAVSLLGDETWALGLRALLRVCRHITTHVRGEPMGPLPPIWLLRQVAESASTSRYEAARAIVLDIVENDSQRRHYSEIAEYRLIAARLALAAGDRESVKANWIDACGLMASYGYHKDITIFELLDPMRAMIKSDPAEARVRVGRLQALCWRILHHTDRKETSYSWPTWWALLAEADPEGFACLVTRHLYPNCNDPNPELDKARTKLWTHWHKEADPLIAGVLRLTLPDPLTDSDPDALDRLLRDPCGPESHQVKRLAVLLLARADERPVRYLYSSSDERVAKDALLVDQLNAIASGAGLPSVGSLQPSVSDEALEYDPNWDPSSSQSIGKEFDPSVADSLQVPGGILGIARAARIWKSIPYSVEDPKRDVVIGESLFKDRLLELADKGDMAAATKGLEVIADACLNRSGPEMLSALARALEESQHLGLAARAFALAWTRSRGMRGWGMFGAEQEISSLDKAFALDRHTTLQVLAQDAERFMGSQGISEALIYAALQSALTETHESGADTANRIWDAAFEVIDKRAPRVHSNDIPKIPYDPPGGAEGHQSSCDLDVAFATAAIAGIAHPGLEAKRRSLIATRFLLFYRPDAVVPAIRSALKLLSDPASIAWLLRLLEQHADASASVIVELRDELAELAQRPYLTVRAFARRLLGEQAGPLPQPSTPAPELLRTRPSAIVQAVGTEPVSPPGPDQRIALVAGSRLGDAEEILPGLSDAVRARVSVAVSTDEYEDRSRSQRRTLGGPYQSRLPDALLALDEEIEVTIQSVAASGRAARLMVGEAPSDPAAWEDSLAGVLLDDPTLSLAVERTRQPRPSIPRPPSPTDPIWQRLLAEAPTQQERRSRVDPESTSWEVIDGTVETHSADHSRPIASGPMAGWRIIGAIEEVTSEETSSSSTSHFVSRCQGMEVFCSAGRGPPLHLPPFARGDVRIWLTDPPSAVSSQWKTATCRAIVGVDFQSPSFGYLYPGLPSRLLAPTPWLISTLGMRLGSQFTLQDARGSALTLLSWRTQYESSEDHLEWPRLSGTAVLLRGDLFERLLDLTDGQVALRQFVERRTLNKS